MARRDHQLPIRLDNDVDAIIRELAAKYPRVSQGDIVRSALRHWATLGAEERERLLTGYVMGRAPEGAKPRPKR
jgi:Arc/MetJ-type ribon-helix-helix transcriptional regulator